MIHHLWEGERGALSLSGLNWTIYYKLVSSRAVVAISLECWDTAPSLHPAGEKQIIIVSIINISSDGPHSLITTWANDNKKISELRRDLSWSRVGNILTLGVSTQSALFIIIS